MRLSQNKDNFMSEIKVSIIVPCFNVAGYILRTISALKQQEFRNFEVWLIDDGSTDSTKEICRSVCLHDERFKFISLPHSGPAMARNYVLDNNLVEGDYVWFLDADDIPYNNFLSIMVKQAISNDYDIVYCNYDVMSNGKLISNNCSDNCDFVTREEFIANLFSLRTRVGVNGGFMWNKLIKRKCMYRLRIPDFQAAEDELFLYLLTTNVKKISFIERPLYQYQKRIGQITSSPVFMDHFVQTRKFLYSQTDCYLVKAAYLQAILIFMVYVFRTNNFDLIRVSNLKTLIRSFLSVEKCEEFVDCLNPRYIGLIKFLKIFPMIPNSLLRFMITLPLDKIYLSLTCRGFSNF